MRISDWSSDVCSSDLATPQMGVQDILVTARRQEESLQTTPIAVTALGEAALVRSPLVNVSDVQRTSPSVVLSTGSPGDATFAYVAIRGQGNLHPILATAPSVSSYIDGVYITQLVRSTALHPITTAHTLCS